MSQIFKRTTIAPGSPGIEQIDGNTGSILPVAGVVGILGDTVNISTAGVGANLTITLLPDVIANSFETTDATANTRIQDNFISSGGAAADVDLNIVPKNNGKAIVTNLQFSNDVAGDGYGINDVDHITGISGGASSLQTNTGVGDQLLLRAYDTDTGPAYTTFATLTAGTTPTMDLSDAVTKAGGYIYRAGGTDVPVTDGGTGVSTVPTNGQLLIGNGTNYTVNSVTPGSGITIAVSPGTLSIASSAGGMSKANIVANQTLVKNTIYFVSSGVLSLALPLTASSTLGDVVEVVLIGGTSFSITQDTGGQIRLGTVTSTVTTGSVSSTNQGDWIELRYFDSGLWVASAKQGNFTVI